MSRIITIFRIWLPLAAIVTALCALSYMTVQQSLRQGANDPQIQMAEDAASALDNGTSADAAIPNQQVELSRSLAPFLVVYDASGKPTASSGLLEGKMPDYPIGALEAAKQSGENTVTWQPRADVRIASVVAPYNAGYVVAGRSLREVEAREAQMQAIALAVWLITLVGVLAAVAFGEYVLRSG
jgi:hypothetical protein